VEKEIRFFIYLIIIAVALPAMGRSDPALESKIQNWIQDMDDTHKSIGPAGGTLRFLENKGQMVNMQDGYSVENGAGKCIADTNLLFKASGTGADIYITTWGLSYVFTKMEKSVIPQLSNSCQLSGRDTHKNENTAIHYCRADMELVGADIKKRNIKKEYESEDRIDYYLAHCPDGIMNVHSYEKITIKNIYPGIDWVLYQKDQNSGFGMKDLKNVGGLEYDFVVHPGADPSLIRFRYKWTDKPQLQKDGSMKISTLMGDIVEGIPISYRYDKEKKINTRYVLKGDLIGFKVEKYDTAETLIIDPTLIWASYYGGNVFEEIFSMNADGKNVWLTGSSNSPGFPIANTGGGAYIQGTFEGMTDLIILQFSSCGKLLWSTYYGGSGSDAGNSISSDGKNVWVTGNTNSADFPTLFPGGAYQASLKGHMNAFILQFSCVASTRIWATYYGGSNFDQGYSISSDGTNVWVTGSTQSTDLPTLFPAGTYQQPWLNGNRNAFVLKFDCSTDICIWATYYGGSTISGDVGNSIYSDGANVWVTGSAHSTDFPTKSKVGAYNQSVSNGNGDVFILQFRSTGAAIWATYYGEGIGTSIYSDSRNVWVTGSTSSATFPTQFPVGAYKQATLGGVGATNAFVLQFNCATSDLIWATYYGGSGGVGDVGNSIQSDGSNVWVSGSTTSQNFPTLNSACSYYKGGLAAGSNDSFILQFTTSGIRLWATYYGDDTEMTGDGTYIASDGMNVFVAGDAEPNGAFPVLNPGGLAYFNPSIGTNETAFIAKFSIACEVLTLSPDISSCSGDSSSLSAGGAISYSWSPAAGLSSISAATVKTDPAMTTTYTVTGNSTTGCSFATATVTVMILPAINVTAAQLAPAVCNLSDGSAEVMATGGTGMLTYTWSNLITGVTNNNIGAGTYTVTVTDTKGCSGTSSATIQNSNGPKVNVVDSINTCQGKMNGAITLSATAMANTYVWSNGSTTQNQNNLPGGTYTVTVTDGTGCTATKTVTILQLANPSVMVGPDTAIKKGQFVQLIANSSGGKTYLWTPSSSLNSDTIYNPIADPTQTTNYTVTVTGVNSCSETASIQIAIEEVPNPCDSKNVFVPTAFSPNGDGQNDILYVRGALCATQLHFQLFDRWGEVVFETTNPATGWDGTFKGKTMETGVFAYYLTATLSNGQNINGRGNVTLVK